MVGKINFKYVCAVMPSEDKWRHGTMLRPKINEKIILPNIINVHAKLFRNAFVSCLCRRHHRRRRRWRRRSWKRNIAHTRRPGHMAYHNMCTHYMWVFRSTNIYSYMRRYVTQAHRDALCDGGTLKTMRTRCERIKTWALTPEWWATNFHVSTS